MGNFYRDNSDIQFLLRHLDMQKIAALCEDNFRFASQFRNIR